MLKPKQIAVIQIAKKQLGLDDDSYRVVLRHFGGVESSKDLTLAGFEDVMDYFNNCGFRSSWLERTYGHRDGMATPKQIDLIRTMWADYSGADSEMDLNAWLENSFKVSALRFVDANAAGKAITALKHMTARQKKKKTKH